MVVGKTARAMHPSDSYSQHMTKAWWHKNQNSNSVPFLVVLENVDRERLMANATLLEAVEDGVREALGSQEGVGITPNIVKIIPSSDCVFAMVLNASSGKQATELQNKLSNSPTLGSTLARYIANVPCPSSICTGVVEVSEIVVPTVPVGVGVSLEIPAIALFVILTAIMGLQCWKTRPWGKAAKPESPTLAAAAAILASSGTNASGDSMTTPRGPYAVPPSGGGSGSPGGSHHTEDSDEHEKWPEIAPIIGLFRLATPMVRLQIFIAVLFSIAFGIAMPMQFLFLRDAMKALFVPNDDGTTPPVISAHTRRDAMVRQVFSKYFLLAIVLFLSKSIGFLGIEMAARRQALSPRRQLFLQLMRKGPAWFAQRDAAELADQFTTDVQVFQNGIGEHFTNLLRVSTMAVTCLVLSFMNEPRTALILAAALPVTGYCISTARDAMMQATRVQQQAYSKAGGVAGRALSMIRVVVAFNGQSREVHKYQSLVTAAEAHGVHAGVVCGWAWGTAKVTNLCTTAIGFYAATFFIISGYQHGCWRGGPTNDTCISGGTILASIFLMMRCTAMTLASLPESITQMAAAQCAAGRAFALLDEGAKAPPTGDPRLTSIWASTNWRNSEVLLAVKGEVTYEDVVFAYPGERDGRAILNGFTAHVPAGATAAFVGLSGSGKSTALALLLGFYEAQAGAVRLDGYDIRGLSQSWLRSRIALVDQEPVLFGCSILENIRRGRADATVEEAKDAARTAGAEGFILTLPDGYATNVGDRGSKLSGGQKQRIAIARALVREPSVLLLDEATSALDTESERAIQQALGRLLKATRWTTIIVAHRLSTIREVDLIFVMQDGQVVEYGTHVELMEHEGTYSKLVSLQFGHGEQASLPDAETVSDMPAELDADPSMLPTDPSMPRLPLCDITALGDTKDISRVHLNDVLTTFNSMATGERGFVDFKPAVVSRSISWRESTSRQNSWRESTMSFGRERREPLRELDTASNDPGSPPPRVEKLLSKVEKEKGTPQISVWKLVRLYREDKSLLVLALFATAFVGAMMPVFGRLFAATINDLNQAPAKFSPSLDKWFPSYNARATADASTRTCLLIEALGVLMFLAVLLSHWGLSKAGEQLVCRLRVCGFKAMLQQDMSWLESHSVGGLAEQLACDAPLVKELTCEHLGSLVQSVAMVIVGLVIMFRASALLTLCIVSLFPLIFAVSLAVAPYKKRRQKRNEENMQLTASVIFEGLDNIRTVAAFGLESRLVDDYVALLVQQGWETWSVIMVLVKCGPAAIALLIGSAVLLSNKFIEHNWMQPEDAMRVLMPLVWCNIGVFRGADFFTEKDKAMGAVHELLETIERAPTARSTKSGGGECPDDVLGKVEFSNVCFKYPSRPGVPVLTNFDLTIPANHTVALVGCSGSGKSTVVSLMLRFYDPEVGRVMLDGRNLRDLNTQWLRERIGLVQQEPALFGGSVMENIRYGSPSATDEEVMAAAQLAGAHDFIKCLRNGYGTEAGDKAVQLSGGQKQRIAIARALVRKPAVLLLDEPTSALDAESERVVQASLNIMLKAQQRTTVIVAHRLCTIQRADIICVVQKGTVIERGSHQELLAMPDGHYKKLFSLQGDCSPCRRG